MHPSCGKSSKRLQRSSDFSDIKMAHQSANARHRKKQFLPRPLGPDPSLLLVHSQGELDDEHARHLHTSVLDENKLATTL